MVDSNRKFWQPCYISLILILTIKFFMTVKICFQDQGLSSKICQCVFLKLNHTKVSFKHSCTSKESHSKNLTSLLPLIFLWKHISLYAIGRIWWILDIIWPLIHNFQLKNQRNWLKHVWMLKSWSVINCFFMH